MCMLLNDYSRQALVLETRTAVCAARAGLGWCLVCMGSAQSFGCWAGDRMPPVSENSVPTACPEKSTLFHGERDYHCSYDLSAPLVWQGFNLGPPCL